MEVSSHNQQVEAEGLGLSGVESEDRTGVASEGLKGGSRKDRAFLHSGNEPEKEIMASRACGDAQNGHKEKGILFPGKGCDATCLPEGVWSSPRLCVARQRQAGRRAVSKGRAQPGGAAGG